VQKGSIEFVQLAKLIQIDCPSMLFPRKAIVKVLNVPSGRQVVPQMAAGC